MIQDYGMKEIGKALEVNVVLKTLNLGRSISEEYYGFQCDAPQTGKTCKVCRQTQIQLHNSDSIFSEYAENHK